MPHTKVDDGREALSAFGARVRRLRRERGLTLQDVADRAGISGSTVSKIENSNLSPTFDGLLKLARGLGVDMATLLDEGQGAPPAAPALGRIDVTRAAARPQHDAATYLYEPLATGLKRKLIDASFVVVRARDPSEFDALVTHPGEELVFVLSGEVELHSEFYAPIRLGPGDSVYYDARMGHALISVGEEDATLLNIVTGGTGRTGEADAQPG